MKKILALMFFAMISLNLFSANWLDQVTDTVNTVNNIVNDGQVANVTIEKLKNSGNTYINKTVQISGKVMGMAVVSNKEFAIFVQQKKAKVQVVVNEIPNCLLMDKIVVKGVYNGKSLDNATIMN